MREKQLDNHHFPIRLVRGALVAMALLIGANAWLAWHANDRIREIATSQVAIQMLADELRDQGDAIELYTLLAIETGREEYVDRYDISLRRIREALQQLQQESGIGRNSQAVRQLASLDAELVRLEEQALRLASAGRVSEARAILNDESYAALAGAYQAGTQQIYRRSIDLISSRQAQLETYLLVNLASAFLMFIMLVIAWFLVVRPARSWGAALKDAQAEANRANRAKSQFLSVMSHEIRTPLNSIIGFAELLLTGGKLSQEERHQVELIDGAGAMLLTVVNDLLDFSKIEAGKIELSPEPFAVEALVDNCVSILRGTAEDKGLQLRVEIDPRLSTFYLGDQNRLRQVLLNLLNNAVKFTSAGTVTLSVGLSDVGAEGDRICFVVTDTGLGIDADQQKRLFQPFVQADASITRKFGGSGLGLSISKTLVELMRGDIGFSSQPGRGSRFWFAVTLPREKAPEPYSARELVAASQSARILVAEDLPMNQELARAVIERAGHRVDIAADGTEAVRAVQERDYDLVLMDIQMPNMDGITATKAIRALEAPAREVPILAMTANVLPEQVREFLAAGMNGHVGKPVRQKDLHAAIAAALAGTGPHTPQSHADTALEEEVFASVLDSLPLESLRGHVKALQAQVEEVASASPTEAEQVEAVAHKIVSQAGMLGLMRLSAAARQVENAARERLDMARSLTAFRDAAGDIDKELWPRLDREGSRP